MFLEYSLCPKCTVYVPQYSLCTHIKVYDTTVQIMSLEYSLCP